MKGNTADYIKYKKYCGNRCIGEMVWEKQEDEWSQKNEKSEVLGVVRCKNEGRAKGRMKSHNPYV